MRRILWRVLAMLGLEAASTAAQSAPLPPCASDSAVPHLSLMGTVALTPPTGATDSSVRAGYLLLAQAVITHFVSPTPLELPDWPGTFCCSADSGGPTSLGLEVGGLGLDGQVSFRLTSQGRLVPHSTMAATPSASFNRAIFLAVSAADSARELLVPAGLVHRDTATIVLRIVSSSTPIPDGLPVLRIRLSGPQVSHKPVVLHQGDPAWPRELYTAPLPAIVTLAYVIDARGRVLPASIKLVETVRPEFVQLANDIVASSTYEPGHTGACPMPVLVQQVVGFRKN